MEKAVKSGRSRYNCDVSEAFHQGHEEKTVEFQ